MYNTSNWDSIEAQIERHESGCWTWIGAPVACNVHRLVAEAYGTPLPIGKGKLYRMPGCTLGTKCVNPNHIGTREDYMLTLMGRRRDISEPSRAVAIEFTPQDKRFLTSLGIDWE